MKVPLWAVAIVLLCIGVMIYRKSKQHDLLNSDQANKVQSLLTDNPFTNFLTRNRG